jgi:hypothetical protein
MLEQNAKGSESQYDMASKFNAVFKENCWGNDESVSGAGSALASPSVRDSVKVLDMVIRQYSIKSIADVPCGDFYWIPIILGRFPKIDYFGFDIVPDLIKWNRERYPDRQFHVADVCSDVLPPPPQI